MSSNLLLDTEFDSDAPWNKEEPNLLCPSCHSGFAYMIDNICICQDCGYEDYVYQFVQAYSNDKNWQE